MFYSKQKY